MAWLTYLITSPMMALIPYSVLHTDTAWAKTDDNCSKCCSSWLTFTLASVKVWKKYTIKHCIQKDHCSASVINHAQYRCKWGTDPGGDCNS